MSADWMKYFREKSKNLENEKALFLLDEVFQREV
jgi:hypothetical protein